MVPVSEQGWPAAVDEPCGIAVWKWLAQTGVTAFVTLALQVDLFFVADVLQALLPVLVAAVVNLGGSPLLCSEMR